eukprot:jgi/Mesvir1/2566/Mv10311-RA.1
MGDVLKNLGTCKARKLYANELWSGDGLTDAKNVLLVGHTNVDLLPNKENNSAIGAVSQINKSTHRVNVHGDLAVHGDLVNNGRITTTSTGLEVAPARGAVRLAGYTDIDMVPNRENGSDVGSISQVNKATHRVNVHGDLAVHDDLLASDVKSLGSTLRLSGTSDVAVDSDLVVTATGGGKGVISSSVGDIELRPASGTVKVVGNVEIAGLVSSVTINAVTNEVEDTTLSLANPAHTLVAHWPFDGDSLVDVAGSAIAMTVEGGAILGGQFKTSVDGVGTASVANAAFPSVTESFDVGFNVTFVDGLPVAGRGVARYGHVTDEAQSFTLSLVNAASFQVTGGGADPVIGAFLFATNVPYAFRIVREYDAVDPHLSTVKVYVNNVIRASATGGTSLAVTAIPSLPSLVLGDVQDLGLGHEVRVDNIKIQIPTPPTNAYADGAGIRIEGDGKVDSVAAPRAITWRKGDVQEAGDHTGAYWHFEGGQLVFSRLVASASRKAPGTDILLSSLPDGAAETHHYPLNTSSARVGQPTFLSNHGPGEFDQTDREWKSKFDTATTASYVSASHASMKYRGGRNHAVATVTVKPKTSLGACTGAGYPFARNTSVATIAASPSGTLELFAFGSLSTPGEHVRVWVFKGGALLASNGLVYAETSSPVVASREFQLGVGVGVSGTDGAVVLYVNGVPQTLSAAKLLSDESAGAQTWDVTLGLTETVAVRLGSPAYGSGEKPIDVWYKNLRLVDTNHASFQGITLDAYYMSALAAIILFHTYTSHTYLKKVTRCRSTDWRCWWTQYGMFSVGLVSAAGLAYLAWKDSRTGLGSPTPIASALQLVGGG